MAGLGRIHLEIGFEGDSRYLEGVNPLPTSYIWAIDLPKCGGNEVCAVYVGPEGSKGELQEGKLLWEVSKNGEIKHFGSRISVPLEYANTMGFTVRLFESNGYWFSLFRGALRWIWGSSSSSGRRDIPIEVTIWPDLFKDGESYHIQIESYHIKAENGGWCGVSASIRRKTV